MFCTLVDPTKAFDRVVYVKLFKLLEDRKLVDRKLPLVCLRLLLNLSANQVTRVAWNAVCSKPFQCFTERNKVR